MSGRKGMWVRGGLTGAGRRRRLAALGAAALGLGAVLPAARAGEAGETSKQELLEQLKALQAKVEKLEAGQQDQAAERRRADAQAVDATVDRVLRDADRRSQFLQAEGFTAGYSNGKFLIQSADGKFVLNPNIQAQFRYVADFRQDTKNGGEDDNQAGFEFRRLKFAFDGNVFDKNTTYKFQWATNRANGTPQLDEGWVRHDFAGTPFAVRIGSQINDWDHETSVSSKRQLAVERSVLHEVIAGGATSSENYTQGVQFIYEPKDAPYRAWVMYHDGFSSRNTNFTDSGGGSTALGLNNPQGAVAGRAEYKFDGDWSQYNDFTALGNKKDLLVVGGGFDVDWADNTTAFFHTVDVQWEPQAVRGLSVYGAYVGLLRDARNAAAGTDDSPYDWGFVVQAGYMLNDQWEVFGRYDYTDLDSNAPAGAGTLGAAARVEDKLHELTVGVNYYLKSHAAKFTVDATYLPNGSPLDLNGAGILSQPNNKDQFLLRAQFQLLL